MKKLITLTFAMFFALNLINAQAPKSFKYQAIVRDIHGNVITANNVSLQINIIQDTSVGGTIVYCEDFINIKPTNIGMVNLDIGKGIKVSGTFNSIDWGKHKFYIGINMDPVGGTNFSPMGITELISVPYALYAATAGNSGSSSINLTGTGSTTVTGSYPNYNINGSYQYLRSSNDTIYLTNGGFVKLPYTAGTGIGITGTNIINTMPNATHTGDAIGSGTLTVVSIQGNPVTTTSPSLNQVLSWNGSAWAPATNSGTSGSYYAGTGLSLTGNTFSHNAHTGDAIGQTNLTVVGIQGNPVSTTAPSFNQVLSWNGNAWTPAANAGQSYFAGAGLTITGNTFSHIAHTGDVTGQTYLTVVALQGRTISTTAPTTNQVLSWNGSAWAPANSGITHYVGQLYGGGIICWVDYLGLHGYIVSLIDVSTGDIWSNVTSVLIGTAAESTWDGKSNSTAIIAQSGCTTGAAIDCHNYTNANYGSGIYSDWYLPSIYEFNLIYNVVSILNKNMSSITGANLIGLNNYWTSTEYNSNGSYYYSIGASQTNTTVKYAPSFYVRAIRTF